jgi:dihydroxyacid dehydratase/phosphogluconate dehydratase
MIQDVMDQRSSDAPLSESVTGGGLAWCRTGPPENIDPNAASYNVLVDEEKLARRRCCPAR